MHSEGNRDDIQIIFDNGPAPESTELAIERPAVAPKATPKSVEDTWAAIQELIKSTAIIKLRGDNQEI